MRDNDMVAIMLFNPEASMLDLEASGINGNNTGIKDEKDYLKIKDIQENNKFKDDQGNFSEAKFHEFYVNALKNYNVLAAGWQPVFHENNIFAPATQRRNEPEFVETTISNPFQQTSSFKDLGEWGPKTKSVREIAESQPVYDTETGKWLDTPEDSFFGTIGMGPLVLATWDFDADKNGNPTSNPEEIAFKKGDYKLNDKGTFYYETLGGRSSYGRELLHYSDIITKEDSDWNKIDFLDSDDLEKSVMGTVAKNVALVGSMFLPGGVGYAVTAATLLQQSLKLGAALNRMLIGSENHAMNNFQAFMSASDLHESASDYARNKVWSWENLINTAGDAISQLRQQRVLFEAVPWALGYGKLGKGEGIFSAKGQEALEKELLNKHSKILLDQRRAKFGENQTVLDFLTQNEELKLVAKSRAVKEANELTKNLSKFSGAVSKAYMTGITVNDMFDEAKEAGMTDFGAAAMTLGYAAAEYALLSTAVGELILPELRAERAMTRQLVKKISEPTKKAFETLEKSATTPEQKENFFWKLFNTGKKLYQDNRAGLGGAALNATVGGIGEGVEEISEEFLADAFRVIHDLGNWSEGDMFNSDNMLDRYGMNFVGGLIGGGVNGLNTDFSAFKRINNMTSDQAMKELIYKINNGDLKEIMNAINNNKWGDTNLSDRIMEDENGELVYAQAQTQKESQDEIIKTMLRNQINSIVNVLEANGARISNPTLFDINTLKETRFAMLANTSTSARYSEEFAGIVSKLVKNANEQREEDKKLTDEQKRDTESEEFQTYKRNKQRLEDERKELVKELEYIKQGKAAAKFIETALLEIHPAISQMLFTGPTLDMFVRRMTNNKKGFRDLSEEEQSQYLEKYKTYKSTSAKDEAIKAYDTWEYIMNAIQNNFAKDVDIYAKDQDKYSAFLDQFYSITESLVKDPKEFFTLGNILSGFMDVRESYDLENFEGQDTVKKEVEQLIENGEERKNKESEKSNLIISDLQKQLGLFDQSNPNQELIKEHDDQISLQQQSEKDRLEKDISDLNNKYELDKNEALRLGTYLTGDQYDNEKLQDHIDTINAITQQSEEEIKKLEAQKIANLTEEQLRQSLQGIQARIKEENNKLLERTRNIDEEVELKTRWKLLNYYINSIENLTDSVIKSGYLNPVTKEKLRRMSEGIDNLIKVFTDYQVQELFPPNMEGEYMFPQEISAAKFVQAYNDDLDITFNNAVNLAGEVSATLDTEGKLVVNQNSEGKLQQLQKKIQEALEIQDTPILALLDSFALDVTGEQTNFSSLFKDINTLIDTTKFTENGLMFQDISKTDLQNLIPKINQAQRLIDLLYAVLMGARSDSAGFDALEKLSTGEPQFQLHFGINSIINEIREKVGDKEKLLTIEGNITDNIFKDLHLLSKNLTFLKNLYGINSGQKLATQNKLRLRTTQLIYKALRKLYDVAPDDIDKSSLSSFFEEGSILLQHQDDNEVDDKTLEEIENARIDLEDALYQFGQDNEGKNFINFSELDDIFNTSSLILNEASEEIDMSSLISYIASRMTIKASDFYNGYQNVISEKIAPLSIQELGIYLHTANALNGNKLTEIIEKFRADAIDWYNGLSKDQKKKFWENRGYKEESELYSEDLMTPYMTNLFLPVPNISNITFLEGIAGSGKTRAVMKVVKDIITETAPELLKDIYIVDTSDDNAKNLAKSLDLEEGNFIPLSRENLLQKISNWVEPTVDKNTGEYVYEEGKDFVIDSQGNLNVNYKLKDGIEIPKLIIIDEVGRYTDLELKLIDNFAKIHGISVLTFGDLDQSRTRSNFTIKIPGLEAIGRKYKLNYKDDLFSVKSNIERTQILHGPKLGFSMRTRNIQQDKNQNLMQEKLISRTGDIMFSYYEGEENGEYILDGAKVINYESNSDYDQKVEEVLQIADKLIKKLDDGEKLGFIYQSKDSKLYKELKDKYGDSKIDFYYKNSAQGKEARYFIYETDFDNSFNDEYSSSRLIEELNTGITRAQDGIVILTKNPNSTNFFGKIGNLQMDSARKLQELPKQQIAEFSNKMKAMYERLVSNREGKLQYSPRNPGKINNINNNPPTFNVLSVDTSVQGVVRVNVEPVELGVNNWLKGKRGDLNKITYLTSNDSGANVMIGFEKEDGSNQEIEYDGNLLDLVYIELPTPITPDDVEPPVTVVEETRQVNIEPTPLPPTPPPPVQRSDEELKEIDLNNLNSTQRRDHNTSAANDKMPINLYTNAAVETGGWIKDQNGKIAPINGDISSLRIDSMNGLIKLLNIDPSNYKYDDLFNILLKIHNIFLTSETRDELNSGLQDYINNTLGIPGEINIQFGLWTTPNISKGNTRQNAYSMYNRTSDEEAEFDWIDTEDRTLSCRTISGLISVTDTNGNIKKVMIPLAYMTSPLTRMQDSDNNGALYPEVLAHFGPGKSLDDSITDILNDPIIYSKYPALYNLFKLYRFTHSGFFPFMQQTQNGGIQFGWNNQKNVTDVFNLRSSLNNYGIQIFKNRGIRQLNQAKYQTHSKLTQSFIPINEWNRDTRLYKSKKVYMFKASDSQIDCNGILRNVINGRPFILVSEKMFGSDEDMFNAWQNGTPGVKVVYLLPPDLSFKEYMERTIKFIEDPSSNTKPGNDTTSFHILNEIRKNDLQLLKDRLNRIYSRRPQKVDEALNLLSELDSLFERGKQIREQNPSQRTYVEFIQKLTEIDDSGTPINQKLDILLRRIIDKHSGVYNPLGNQETEHKTELDLDLVQRISNIINENYVIYDRVRFDPDASDLVEGLVHEIKSDARNSYRVNGNYLQLDCRVTPPTFGTQELNQFIDDVVNYHIHNLVRKKGDPVINSTTDNVQFDVKLHEEFIRTKTTTVPKKYTPSRKFNNMIDHLQELNINYNYKTPENAQEEQNIVNGIINKINTDSSVKAIIYIDSSGNIRHIDYTGSELEGIIGNKNFSENTLKIGDRSFTMEVNGNEATFTEETTQPLQNVTPFTGSSIISDTILNENRNVDKFISVLNKYGYVNEDNNPYEKNNTTIDQLNLAIDNFNIESDQISDRQRDMIKNIIDNISEQLNNPQNNDQSECNKITFGIK